MKLENKKILLTGGSGFLGRFVHKELLKFNPKKIIIPRSYNCDLTKEKNIIKLMSSYEFDLVIHLAGVVGGIGANRKNPAKFFFDNISMGINLIEQARQHKVKKFVCIGTVCAYPKHTPVPFKEKDLWNGYPEETNAPYGIAKRALLVQCQAYRAQYNMNAIFLIPVNLYGPGDNFDLNTSHVIPALIKKIIEAKMQNKKKITVWGTGNATREFLYVEDCAEAIIQAVLHYDGGEPINIGTGHEILIKDLVKLICKLCDYKGKIIWDKSKPNGQPRRCLDISKATKYLSWKAKTPFEQGLKKTIEWYKKNFCK